MFLYLLLLSSLQLIPSFINILEDPSQLLFSSSGLFILRMSDGFGVKVVGLHGLVELQMGLTVIQLLLFLFDLVDLLLLLYAFLEHLLYHVGLLSFMQLGMRGGE